MNEVNRKVNKNSFIPNARWPKHRADGMHISPAFSNTFVIDNQVYQFHNKAFFSKFSPYSSLMKVTGLDKAAFKL